MTFKKYDSANNAICSLSLPITNTSNVLIASGNFDRFPASNFIVKVTEYSNGVLIGRENMEISTRVSGTFNISNRAIEAVPIDDNATENIIQALPFSSGSIIELVLSSQVIKDIQDETTRLENDKLNKGGLRSALSNIWSLFFSNGTGSETALALGTAGKVLTSNGTTSAPTFETPTVDILSLTEDTSGDITADFFIKNNGTGQNKKIKVSKYMASDAEIIIGTDQNKFVNSKQLKDNYGGRKGVASNNLKASSDGVVTHNSGSYILKKEIQLGMASGTIRVSFDLSSQDTNAVFGRIYKNGVAVGTERSVSSTSYSNFTEDISYNYGDLIQLYLRNNLGIGTNARNFRISYDRLNFTEDYLVII